MVIGGFREAQFFIQCMLGGKMVTERLDRIKRRQALIVRDQHIEIVHRPQMGLRVQRLSQRDPLDPDRGNAGLRQSSLNQGLVFLQELVVKGCDFSRTFQFLKFFCLELAFLIPAGSTRAAAPIHAGQPTG